MRHRFRPIRSGLLLSAVATLSLVVGCGKSTPTTNDDLPTSNATRTSSGGAPNGLGQMLFGGGSSKADAGSSIGVNAFLWRGTLDTLAFMPLASADPFGGVIITDWYTPAGGGGERFKATAFILGRELRADAIKVSIFRQTLDGGQWMDAPVSAATVTEIENRVLARARELRSQSMAGS